LFCDGSSQQIIDMLLKEADAARVKVLTGCSVSRIESDGRFTLSTSTADFECQSLVIATGGLSVPKIGATDFGYAIARQFAIHVIETRPGLVPLTLHGAEGLALRDLSGVSLEAIVRFDRTSFKENVLFTHRGLSGPAILQISSYWRPGQPIKIEPRTAPRRFEQKWQELYGNEAMEQWKVTPSGTEGYAKAEVTVGGIDTAELSSKTMEARRVPGLYFIGEVVDVTGQLGGFNFQWAWASGFVAGQYV
jgi:predicted flavoprotein YhiN